MEKRYYTKTNKDISKRFFSPSGELDKETIITFTVTGIYELYLLYKKNR